MLLTQNVDFVQNLDQKDAVLDGSTSIKDSDLGHFGVINEDIDVVLL